MTRRRSRLAWLGRGVVAAVLMATLVLPAAPLAGAAAPRQWRLGGAGFGHGVGMSQYGAYVQEASGGSAAQIVSTYDSGPG